MKKAIIFDNDGVLVDTEPLYFQATREMCAELGKELSLDEYVDCHIKNSYGTRRLMGLSDAEFLPWRGWRNTRYSELLNSGNHTIDGVPEMVAELAQRYRLCIVTSSLRPHFDIIHRDSAYLGHFEFVIAREDVIHSKPSPEPYLKAMSRLCLPARDCVVVEDSYRGLHAALAAELDCIVLRSALSPYMDLRGAQQYVDDVREIPAAIARTENSVFENP